MAGAGYDISLAASDTKAFKFGDFSANNGFKFSWQAMAIAGALLLVALLIFKRK